MEANNHGVFAAVWKCKMVWIRWKVLMKLTVSFFLFLSGSSRRQVLRPQVAGSDHLPHGHPVHDHHHRQRHRQGGLHGQLHHPREGAARWAPGQRWDANTFYGVKDCFLNTTIMLDLLGFCYFFNISIQF